MTCYNLECSHWLKLQHSDWRANLVQDLKKNSTNESTQFITGYMIYNLAYTYKFQLKTALVKRPLFNMVHMAHQFCTKTIQIKSNGIYLVMKFFVTLKYE